MTLSGSGYWLLLVWLFTGGLLLTELIPRKSELVLGRSETRTGIFAAVAVMLPYILWGGFRGDIADTYLYRKLFNEMPTGLASIPEYLTSVTKDKGFSVLSILEKTVFGDNSVIYFLLFAAFQLLILAFVLRKYSCDYWLSVFLFVASTEYMSWVQNGMRQFIAVMLIMAGTHFHLTKKYIYSVLLILLAATIHGSALLMLPILFIVQGRAWNKKTIITLLAGCVALIFADRFTTQLDLWLSDTQYKNVVSDWVQSEDDGMNPIRALVYAIPMLLSLVGFRYIKAADDPVINFCTNASIVTTALCIVAVGTSGIFIGRLPIYTSLYSTCILLPWEIHHFFEKRTSRLIKGTVIVCYVLFFYYQMHFAWGKL